MKRFLKETLFIVILAVIFVGIVSYGASIAVNKTLDYAITHRQDFLNASQLADVCEKATGSRYWYLNVATSTGEFGCLGKPDITFSGTTTSN